MPALLHLRKRFHVLLGGMLTQLSCSCRTQHAGFLWILCISPEVASSWNLSASCTITSWLSTDAFRDDGLRDLRVMWGELELSWQPTCDSQARRVPRGVPLPPDRAMHDQHVHHSDLCCSIMFRVAGPMHLKTWPSPPSLASAKLLLQKGTLTEICPPRSRKWIAFSRP